MLGETKSNLDASLHPGYIFLSHSGTDTYAASRFAELLRGYGLEVWFDKDNLQPGEPWMAALESAVEHASAMIVYVGRLGVQAWVDREVRLGLVRNTRDPTNFQLIPVLGEGSDLNTLPAFLQQHQCVDLRDAQLAPREIARLLEKLRRASAERSIAVEYWTTHSPFRGLQVFQPEDAWLFFGRDADSEQLIDRLARAPVLAVLGNSGSGKSSLIRAGLVPALRHGRLRMGGKSLEDWRIAIFRPSEAPFAEMAESLPRQLAPELAPLPLQATIEAWRQSLAAGGSTLRNAIVAMAGSGSDGSPVLLVVDQFEEIFTLTPDVHARRKYIDALFAAARRDSSISVHLVIVMRADFYSQCLDHPELSGLLETNLYNVSLISPAQMRENIEKRLALAGAKAEPGLIESLLADAGTEPGNLALLEHALGELWRKRSSDRTLTNAAYADIGRLRGALARHADSVYLELTESDKILACEIFLALVQLGEGSPDTRCRVEKKNLLELGNPGQVEALLAQLSSARLISTGDERLHDSFVEVSHEALIREWPKFRDWISKNREDLTLERRLRQAAEEWVTLNRDSSALLHGVRLGAAEDWLARQAHATARLRQFIEASCRARDQAAQRESEARKREQQVEQARRRRRFWILGGIAAFVVALAIITVFVYRNQRTSAEARELSAWAAESLVEDPERSLILGLHSWGKHRSMLGGLEEILHAAVLESHSRLTLRGHQGRVVSAAWSPEGTKLATAGSDQTAKVWDVATGHELLAMHGHQGAVESVAWSPRGDKLATASDDRTGKVWDASTGRELLTLRGHQDKIWAIAWSPDGSKLATASHDNTTKLWDASTGQELLTLRGHQGPVSSTAWSPNGRRVATASYDHTAKVWDSSTGQELLTLRGHQGSVGTVAWSRDGRKLATTSSDRTAKVWEVSTGRELVTLWGHQNEVWDIAWSPDGSKLATASADETAKVWYADTGRELLTLHGHHGVLESISWSPDGNQLATTSSDQTAKVWEAGTDRELLTLQGHQAQVWGIAWSPDGNELASASADHTAKVWEAGTGRELLTLRGHQAQVWGIAWSPDGSELATASADHTAKVWEARRGRKLLTLDGHQGEVRSVAWSPEGSRLVTASTDRTAKVWEAHTGRELFTLRGHQGEVLSVAWSPKGSRLATASADRTAKVWDASTGQELLSLPGHQGEVESIAWSPDGSKLATASADHTAMIWNAATGQLLLTFRGHQGVVLSIAWSHDGTMLATASSDQTAKLWETSTGRELLSLRGHQAEVRSIAWSPDGKRLASAGSDSITQVYAIDNIELLRLVRSRITRDLTQDECRHYLNTEICPKLPEVP